MGTKMKGKTAKLLLGCLVALSIIITGCNSPASEGQELTLTEAEKQMLEERGVLNTYSVEIASRVAGFTVFTPAYIPEGFNGGQFMVSKPVAGSPAKFDTTNIQQAYTWSEDWTIMFSLVQAPHKFGVGGEPVEVCGFPGERKLLPAEGDRPASLTLAWSDGERFYSLYGTLAVPITEEVLHQIACSVGAD